mgnify:CR=1 FL=1
MNFKNPEEQSARWIKTLGICDLEVEHRQGRNHGNADGLSRRTCDNCHCERSEKKDHLEADGEGKEIEDEQYRCTTATNTNESSVFKNHYKGTSLSSWLLTLSNKGIREAQLRKPCLGAVVRLKEQSTEGPAWETFSMESPTFKKY